MNPLELGSLSTSQWETLQEILERFEIAWQDTAISAREPELHQFLPPSDDPLRPIVLQELIKSELEIRWRRGHRVDLDYYLTQAPELGSRGALAPDLIYEEYRVRHRYGDKAALSAYQVRFPGQYEELQRLVDAQPVLPAGALASAPGSGASASASHELKVTSDQVLHVGEGYKLISRISRGNFGDVWRAEAPGGVEVAIKIIFASVAENQGQRELQALQLIKHLHHPFLLPIHAFWQMEDRLMIAMELAEGSLRDRLQACNQEGGRGGIPADELLGYFREAAEALDYLHGRRVLHRDIKPENILLFEGHIKVADFNLARVVEQTRRLSAASHCGTPAYTAPEVFWRGMVGAGSDQYSLAVTYAELRLNRLLFPTRNWLQLMHDHLQRMPDLTPLLDAEQRVLRQALAKDSNERFKSCREFVQALERAVRL
jgi:hypothetical protein